jgi:IS5 family transposase
LRVYTSGQKRPLTPQIKRELRRRAAIEPVIDHLKAERCRNAVLAAAGYNFHLLLRWLELVLSRFLAAQKQQPPSNGSENRKLHGRPVKAPRQRKRTSLRKRRFGPSAAKCQT